MLKLTYIISVQHCFVLSLSFFAISFLLPLFIAILGTQAMFKINLTPVPVNLYREVTKQKEVLDIWVIPECLIALSQFTTHTCCLGFWMEMIMLMDTEELRLICVAMNVASRNQTTVPTMVTEGLTPELLSEICQEFVEVLGKSLPLRHIVKVWDALWVGNWLLHLKLRFY
jgi:hypothetical protein